MWGKLYCWLIFLFYLYYLPTLGLICNHFTAEIYIVILCIPLHYFPLYCLNIRYSILLYLDLFFYPTKTIFILIFQRLKSNIHRLSINTWTYKQFRLLLRFLPPLLFYDIYSPCKHYIFTSVLYKKVYSPKQAFINSSSPRLWNWNWLSTAEFNIEQYQWPSRDWECLPWKSFQ